MENLQPSGPMVLVSAENKQVLRQALALLRCGAGEQLTGHMQQTDDWMSGFIGELAMSPGPSAAAYLGAMIRALLFTGPESRRVAELSARLWLASHCTFCGSLLPQERYSFDLTGWCVACEELRNADELGHLQGSEVMHYDRETILSFIRDPRTPEQIRDQFYLLMMEEEIFELAREGYAKAGRGAVVLDQGSGKLFAGYYLDLGMVSRGVGWPNEEAARWVGEYNPAIEVVVIFVKPVPLPPEVYRVQQNPALKPVELTYPRPVTKIAQSA